MKNFFRNFLARRNQSGAKGTPPNPPRCPFPNCGVEITPIPGRPAVCPGHLRLIDDVQFILQHLRPVEPARPKGPDIIVPRGPMPKGPGPRKAG